MKRERATRRRIFLGGMSGLLVACSTGAEVLPDPSTGGSPGSGGGPGSGGSGGAPGVGGGGGNGVGGAGGQGPLDCTPTADNILGPYYRPNAPFLDDLTTPGMPGIRFHLSGKVRTPDCEPIGGAILDFWQADDEGSYDNDGVNDPPPGTYVLRGKVEAAADGSFELTTIIPGHYLNGPQYRPAHIHVRVSAPGFEMLTTQLYFSGDPFNEIDPFIIDSLIMDVQDAGNDKAAVFDFVLPPV